MNWQLVVQFKNEEQGKSGVAGAKLPIPNNWQDHSSKPWREYDNDYLCYFSPKILLGYSLPIIPKERLMKNTCSEMIFSNAE